MYKIQTHKPDRERGWYMAAKVLNNAVSGGYDPVEYAGPFPSKRLAKKAKRDCRFRSISILWIERWI